MKNLFLKSKKILLVVFNILLIAISFYLISTSEKIQKKYSPKKYWKSQINNLEGSLKNNSVKLKTLEIDLEKEIFASTWHQKEASLKAQAKNLNVDDTFRNMKDEHFEKIEKIRNEIFKLKVEEKKEKDLLDNAVCQLDSMN